MSNLLSSRRRLLLGCLLFISFQGLSRAEDPPAPEELKQIVEAVQQAQKAGFEKHDIETYMSSWAEKATFVGGRSEKPDEYDITLTRDQIEDTRKILFNGPAIENVRLNFSDTQSEYKDKTVIIRWTVQVTFPRLKQKTGERYDMIQTDDGWKILKNRGWIISYQPTDKPDLPITLFDKAKWKESDRNVELVTADPNSTPTDRVYALWDAARHAEGYALICKELTQQQDDPDLWYWRGISAFQLGNVEDARKSFVRARELNPDLQVPIFSPKDLKIPSKSRDQAP